MLFRSLMIGFALAGLLLRIGGRYATAPLFLKGLVAMSITPFIAVLAGWFVTEVGRSPWLIYGVMTHAQGVTPSLTGGMALFTLIGYILVYAVIFSAGIYYLMRMFQAGLESLDTDHPVDSDHAKRPLSAAHVPFEKGE